MDTADEDWIDSDILAMKLGWGERAGLQIYRNYTKAFEKDAIKKFREALVGKPNDYSDFEKLAHFLVTEDVRFLPVIACGYADEKLKEVFTEVIPNDVPGGKREMLSGYGPLSDLSKRIRLAYAFQVLSPDLMEALDRVRSARNRISHDWDLTKIEDFHLSGPVSGLTAIEAMLNERGKDFPELNVAFDPVSAFRVRLIWIMGRLAYEASLFGAAKTARLNPYRALYGDGGTEWLTRTSRICLDSTHKVIALMADARE